MSWEHRKTSHGYHEWRYAQRRTFRNREVWSEAIVVADSGDSDAFANWEVVRDGWVIRRGQSTTVTAAKKHAYAALWKPAASWARKRRRS